jgi:hypothetical protein
LCGKEGNAEVTVNFQAKEIVDKGGNRLQPYRSQLKTYAIDFTTGDWLMQNPSVPRQEFRMSKSECKKKESVLFC